MRILAVDDDPSIRELLPLITAKAGFPNVTAVESAEHALAAINQSADPFECLLLDIDMPGCGGIELCALVRHFDAYRTAPIIMLTTELEADNVESALKAGATDYATKPVDVKELGARLRTAQELVTVYKQLSEALSASTITEASEHDSPIVQLDEAVFVPGVRDMVNFTDFRNYLEQMSRSGVAAIQIFAIKIDRVAQIHSQASPAEFLYALTEVGHAIAEALLTTSSTTSYAGNGRFLSLSRSTMRLDAGQIESDIQQILDEKCSLYDSGAPLDLEVSVGSPAQPHFADPSDSSLVVDRVFARVEHRSSSKNSGPGTLNIRPIRF